MCHSRTKCKFSIFLSILLGVFEAQVTVDRWRAVILRVGVAKRCKYCQKLTFCKQTRRAPSRAPSRPECDFPTCAVACVCSCSLENPQSKACGKNLECSARGFWLTMKSILYFTKLSARRVSSQRLEFLSWMAVGWPVRPDCAQPGAD